VTDWSIRSAISADIAAVLAMWEEGAAVASVSDSVEGIAALLARDPEALLVAEADGAIIGSVVVGWDGWRGQLYRLAVLPAWRRRGVATALVRAAEGRLASLGAKKAAAIVIAGHDHAAAFWSAMGYAPEDQHRYTRVW